MSILKLRGPIEWESFRTVFEQVTCYAGKDWSKGVRPIVFGMLIAACPIPIENQ